MEEPSNLGSHQSTTKQVVCSIPRPSFWACLEDLPAGVQATARDLYENYFKNNPKHPLLKGKFVPDRRKRIRAWRVDISRHYRALAAVDEKVVNGITTRTYVWYWCGSHEAYNNIVG